MKQLALDIGLAPVPTLEGFFPGPNAAPLQHLKQALIDTSARAPVPTYLWGEAGSGKTHLLQAVREALREQGASVGWRDAKSKYAPPFDENWAGVLLDDVHLYTQAQQNVAFNWFINAMSPANGVPRWVISTGGVPPADLPLREDLCSRLGWGHVFHLQMPGEAELRTVLRQQASARGLVLGDDVTDYMLKRFARDLGSLMALLERLDRHALRTQRALTIPLLKDMLDSE
ncbi:MAG: DnaA regulatory inactivator Hda [Giesbergeria sp.]|nr:DnaA regulatory inactivator Hda [Giesbergeria sp.]MBP6321049.1 DnaA regulatory inactivator Hda [Giesbergeria sp.]MBP6375070.1 DnaA regulatory inactivator Hda [Giesbergeria sp.]MBP7915845.1 DnaA regulatory inactivator Hda [Giesbergeria sp.]MBP8029031.1 DnaA regulatory inactivator Hda [Giesbergeria sp.]